MNTRVFFVTDVHGSERCFKKLLNAGKFYKANAAMLAGDITGKMIVPIVKQSDGTHLSSYAGSEIPRRDAQTGAVGRTDGHGAGWQHSSS
jgi:Icc-related predicted phosphoesterase